MSSEPASLKGIESLLSAGYSISILGAYIVVNDVWYLNASGELQKGQLAAPLTLITPTEVGVPVTHQVHWSGSAPTFTDGTAIPFAAQSNPITVAEVRYPFQLSNKPPEGFATYVTLFEHYVALISGPAEQRHGVSARTGVSYGTAADQSPFKMADTFSARAQVTELNSTISKDRVGIIGLGGTGSFVLDFLVKSPVQSIDAYDFDLYQVHNGFRSPGEVSIDSFGKPKTQVYEAKYTPFRHALKFHTLRIGSTDKDALAHLSFAFVCIDDGEARGSICALLTTMRIPFIDVGIGVEKEKSGLDGLLRTTIFTEDTMDRAFRDVPTDARDEEGAYRTFVQIIELNALNAALAVIRYKQFRRFYVDDSRFCTSLYSIGLTSLAGSR